MARVQIEFNTDDGREITVRIDGGPDNVLRRDSQMNWRRDGVWVANNGATPLDAVKCFLRVAAPME